MEVSESKLLSGIFSKLAGTVFILALAAVAKLKARVRDSDLTHEVVQRINHLLRAPAEGEYGSRFLNGKLLTYRPDCALGKAVVNDVIPAIALLQQRHHISFTTMFSSTLLFSNGVFPEVQISDLERSDELFDKITFK